VANNQAAKFFNESQRLIERRDVDEKHPAIQIWNRGVSQPVM
jgi:hypothetical protein